MPTLSRPDPPLRSRLLPPLPTLRPPLPPTSDLHTPHVCKQLLCTPPPNSNTPNTRPTNKHRSDRPPRTREVAQFGARRHKVVAILEHFPRRVQHHNVPFGLHCFSHPSLRIHHYFRKQGLHRRLRLLEPPASSQTFGFCNSARCAVAAISECFADVSKQRSCFGDSAVDSDWSLLAKLPQPRAYTLEIYTLTASPTLVASITQSDH